MAVRWRPYMCSLDSPQGKGHSHLGFTSFFHGLQKRPEPSPPLPAHKPPGTPLSAVPGSFLESI